MNRHSILVITIFAVLFSACNKKLLPTSTIEKEYGLEKFDFDYLEARTKIKYDGPDKGITSSATIRMKKDSIIWISITPFLGVEAARGMITKDTVVFLDRVNKIAYRYNFESLSRMVNFDLNFEMLQSIILGNQVFSFESKDQFSKTINQIKIKQQRDRFNLSTTADQQLRKVTSIDVSEEGSNNTMKLNFSNYETVSQQAFPYQIDISILSEQNNQAPEETSVKVSYSKVEVSNERISFPFSVPSKYD